MTEREHVYQPMRKALPYIDWCRLENLVGEGMADVNGCQANGVASWIETKIIHGNQVTFQRFQPAWLMKRTVYKDRVFVLARKNGYLYLWAGEALLRLLRACEPRKDGKTLVVDCRAVAPSFQIGVPFDWGALGYELFSRKMEEF